MIDKYNKAAYRRVVWREAARLLREAYFPEEGTAPRLICDCAFRMPPEVPLDSIQEVLVSLHRAEQAEDREMAKFFLEERSDDSFINITQESNSNSPPAKSADPPKKRGRPTKKR